MKYISSFLLASVFLCFGAEAYTPNVSESGSLTKFLNYVRSASISDLDSLRGLFQVRHIPGLDPLASGTTRSSNNSSGQNNSNSNVGSKAPSFKFADPLGSGKSLPGSAKVSSASVRYLYSKRWGWLDMKHFSVAAHDSNVNTFGCMETFIKGSLVELKQVVKETSSAFSYEDMTSNKVGSYFAKYIERSENKNKPLNINLANYLKELEVVEDPSIAPNYGSLSKGQISIGTVHALKKRDQPIDKEIEEWI